MVFLVSLLVVFHDCLFGRCQAYVGGLGDNERENDNKRAAAFLLSPRGFQREIGRRFFGRGDQLGIGVCGIVTANTGDVTDGTW